MNKTTHIDAATGDEVTQDHASAEIAAEFIASMRNASTPAWLVWTGSDRAAAHAAGWL